MSCELSFLRQFFHNRNRVFGVDPVKFRKATFKQIEHIILFFYSFLPNALNPTSLSSISENDK